MALAGVKLDDGRGGFTSNCFPVRPSFGHTSDESSGAWLIAQHAEQRRRFKAVLCAKPRTYSRIKEERKKSELQGTNLENHRFDDEEDEDDDEANDDGKILDGFFLMKHCCVEDPSDLCSVNVANRELTDIKEDDLSLFENVAYVNAGENYLPFEAFRGFPALRELEIPLNGLRNLKIAHTDFTSLEMLDLSYNNLSQDDLLTLGLLTRLKVLHLTGNNFKKLPQELAMPYLSREKQVRLQRFACLEVLLLDDNQLMDMTVFAALAALPKLRHLNLSKNKLFFVPQLKCVEGRVVTQDGQEKKRSQRPGSGRKSSRRPKSRSAGKLEASLVDLEAERATNQSREGQVSMEAAEKKEEALPDEKPDTEGQTVAPERTGSLANIEELMAEDFSMGNLEARIDELEVETKNDEGPQFKEPTDMKMPPYPELRYLSLADNEIYEEESLLAMAAWPLLMEVDIYNNPLTTENSGDPPLLKRFLQERLGIKLNRTKPKEITKFLQKTKVEIRPRNRKVAELVPKVPRLTLEEKLMLELPPPPVPKAVEHASSPIPQDGVYDKDLHGNRKSVLPPIPTTPKEELTQAWAEKITEEDEEEEEEEGYNEEEEERKRAGSEASDTFFMTQVDDVGESGGAARQKKGISFMEDQKDKKKGARARQDKASMKGGDLDDRYKGYELLLDIEELPDEPELPAARDVQGNIRALKHTLNHMLVYRDPAVELSKVKKPVQEFRRAPVPPAQPPISTQEKVDDVLYNLKTRSTLEEEKLVNVLREKHHPKQKFPEAEDLLAQIQRRYNAVRVHSMKDAKQAREIKDSLIRMVPQPPAPKPK